MSLVHIVRNLLVNIPVIPIRSEESVRVNYKYVSIMFIQWPTPRLATTIDNLCLRRRIHIFRRPPSS